jgi:hypothetical protein
MRDLNLAAGAIDWLEGVLAQHDSQIHQQQSQHCSHCNQPSVTLKMDAAVELARAKFTLHPQN